MATDAQRHHIASLIDYLHGKRAQLDYPPGDVRTATDSHDWTLTETQATHLLGSGGRMMFDCSEMVAWTLKCAGLWHWPSPGYTGSDLTWLPVHYTNPKVARIGALCVFGPGTGDHVSMVREPDPDGGNPLMASHGRPGFDLVRLHDEQAVHRAPITFLSIAHL